MHASIKRPKCKEDSIGQLDHQAKTTIVLVFRKNKAAPFKMLP